MGISKKGVSSSAVAAGVGAAALLATAAGAYWFYGSKDATKHRKSARSWMLKARAEVLEAVEKVVEKAGDISKEDFAKIVDDVMKQYSKVAGATADEVAQVSKDMKDVWNHMQKMKKSKAPKKAKKAVKKAAKK